MSFMGNIVGKGAEDIRGEVLACQASSKEEIETQPRSHPSAKVSSSCVSQCFGVFVAKVAEHMGHGNHHHLASRHSA